MLFFYRKVRHGKWVPITETEYRIWEIRFLSVNAAEFDGMALMAMEKP